MPTRILKPGILDSDRVNQLSSGAEVFYRRLMSVADDFGRFDGRPTILRSKLYPLRIDEVTNAQILEWLFDCQKADLISVYLVDGKQFVEILRFDQKTRTGSKYPANDGQASKVCQQMPANDSKCCPYSESESESEKKKYKKKSSPSAPSSVSPKIEIEHENFPEAYEAYPRHEDRRRAHQAYLSALKRGTTHAEIIAAIPAYAKSKTVLDGFPKLMASWLNGDGWKNEYQTRQGEITDERYAKGF